MKSKRKELIREENGSVLMSKENIKIINEIEGLYDEPSLNNKLYLHFKGYCLKQISRDSKSGALCQPLHHLAWKQCYQTYSKPWTLKIIAHSFSTKQLHFKNWKSWRTYLSQSAQFKPQRNQSHRKFGKGRVSLVSRPFPQSDSRLWRCQGSGLMSFNHQFGTQQH